MSDFIKLYCLPLAHFVKNELKLTSQETITMIANAVKKTFETLEVEDENKGSKITKSLKNKEKTTRSKKKEKSQCVCEYVYVRSPKKGERCSSYVDKKSDKYCSKHIKKDVEKPEQKDDKKTKKKAVEKIKTEKTKKINEFSDKLQSFINSKTPLIKIERNADGHYVIYDTSIVVNPMTLEAYAKLKADSSKGELEELSKTDVEYCKENNIKYTLPSNLSTEEKRQTEAEDTDVQELENYDGLSDGDFSDIEDCE
jgi:hypothetical protein